MYRLMMREEVIAAANTIQITCCNKKALKIVQTSARTVLNCEITLNTETVGYSANTYRNNSSFSISTNRPKRSSDL